MAGGTSRGRLSSETQSDRVMWLLMSCIPMARGCADWSCAPWSEPGRQHVPWRELWELHGEARDHKHNSVLPRAGTWILGGPNQPVSVNLCTCDTSVGCIGCVSWVGRRMTSHDNGWITSKKKIIKGRAPSQAEWGDSEIQPWQLCCLRIFIWFLGQVLWAPGNRFLIGWSSFVSYKVLTVFTHSPWGCLSLNFNCTYFPLAPGPTFWWLRGSVGLDLLPYICAGSTSAFAYC
jgi:hypothetical protein